MKKRQSKIITLIIMIMMLTPGMAFAQESSNANFLDQLSNVIANLVTRGVPTEENVPETSELVLAKAFVSDNSEDKSVTINGNILTAQFMTSVPVQITGTPTIDGEPVQYEEQAVTDANDKISYLYTATFDVSSKAHVNGNKIEASDVEFTTIPGDEATEPENGIVHYDGLIIYYEALKINDVKVEGSNKVNPNLLIEGDSIEVTFKSNGKLDVTGEIKAGKNGANFTETVKDGVFLYQAVIHISNPGIDEIKLDSSGISITDGRHVGFEPYQLLLPEKSFSYAAPIKMSQPIIESNHKDQPLIAIKDDIVRVSFQSDLRVTVDKPIKIAGKEADFEEKKLESGYSYSASIKIGEQKDQTKIGVDMNGAQAVDTRQIGYSAQKLNSPQDEVIFYAPVEVELLEVTSDNNKENTVLNGNRLTVTMKTNHAATLSGTLKIGDVPLTMTPSDRETNLYTASLEVVNNMFADGKPIEVDGSDLKLSDGFDTPTTVAPSKTTKLVYYAPLQLGVNINDLNIDTTNHGETHDGIKLVKNGDKIELSFTASRELAGVSGTIFNAPIEFSTTDKLSWKGEFVVDTAWTDSIDLKFALKLFDSVEGNPELELTEQHFQPVRYYGPIQVSELAYLSENPINNVAKIGDRVVVSFKTNHPCNTLETRLENKQDDIVVQSEDGINWKIHTVVSGNMGDLDGVPYYIELSDNASNSVETLEGNSVQYFAPIIVSNLQLSSTNERDGAQYCKVGDTIMVQFYTNHRVSVSGNINGTNPQIKADEKQQILSSVINGDEIEDQSVVTFEASVEDIAGNIYAGINQSQVGNQIIYFAPISADVSLSGTFSKTQGYLKNGDSVSASISSNHATRIISSLFNGKSGVSKGDGTSNPSTTLSIPENEGSMPEGEVAVTCQLDDAAGNTSMLTGSNGFIYDRTRPSIKIEPILTGFFNRTMSFTVSYSDTNLDPNSTSLKINDDETIKGNEINGPDLTKVVELDKENEYGLTAVATDKAGNTADATTAKLIIDKTNPKITSIDIDMDKKTVYKAGFILAEHFKIEDKYIKDITCTLTDKTGIGNVTAWDINAPIETDGLKTAEIISTDMASNTSEKIAYSFYIDGTAPKPIVKNNTNNLVYEEDKDKNIDIKKDTILNISLDEIWMGDEKPDRFTKLELKDSNGKTTNLLNGKEDVRSSDIKCDAEGNLKLLVTAVDDVDNQTEELTYKINVHGADYIEPTARAYSNQDNGYKIILVISAAAIVSIGIIIAYMIFKKKKQINK